MIENIFGSGTTWATAAVLMALIAGITTYNVRHDDARQQLRADIVKVCADRPDPIACAELLGEAVKKGP